MTAESLVGENHTAVNISVQDQPDSDSVHTPLEIPQGQQGPSSAIHVNDNSDHVILNDGGDQQLNSSVS